LTRKAAGARHAAWRRSCRGYADGPTDPTNLHPPSRGWHRAKTFKHWTLTANPDGTITWTSRRTGRSYTTHPYNYRDDP